MVKRNRWMSLPLALMVVALWADLLGAPDDRTLGPSQRIFYMHMAAATVAAIAFTVTLMASLAYLVSRNRRYDIWAAASAELGTIFTSMILLSGVLWGRVAWGVWWTWDPRLTATLILWVLFTGYLLWRQAIDDPDRRARVSAVLAVVAYIDVPIDYMTIRWWRSIHPVVITAHGIHMAPSMIGAMAISQVAMLGLYVSWMVIRVTLLRCEYEMDAIKNHIRMQINGKGV
ncbi:MAG: cytochrome c biogenesis protein CcsA [Firmicutes bacterium]|nr:cytochrome c biogenesis protein CcsA [Bacillota bacterium]